MIAHLFYIDKINKEINEKKDSMEAIIEKRTKKLISMNKNLKDVNTTKDKFVAIASHELRTPLTVIRSYSSMMLN